MLGCIWRSGTLLLSSCRASASELIQPIVCGVAWTFSWTDCPEFIEPMRLAIHARESVMAHLEGSVWWSFWFACWSSWKRRSSKSADIGRIQVDLRYFGVWEDSSGKLYESHCTKAESETVLNCHHFEHRCTSNWKQHRQFLHRSRHGPIILWSNRLLKPSSSSLMWATNLSGFFR